jgi:hypothetical protein
VGIGVKALEDWLDNIEPEGGCREIAMPEDIHEHNSQLEGAEMGTTEGLARENLSGEVVAEKPFIDEDFAGVKTIAEWQDKATREEDVFGSQCDFPIDQEGV